MGELALFAQPGQNWVNPMLGVEEPKTKPPILSGTYIILPPM